MIPTLFWFSLQQTCRYWYLCCLLLPNIDLSSLVQNWWMSFWDSEACSLHVLGIDVNVPAESSWLLLFCPCFSIIVYSENLVLDLLQVKFLLHVVFCFWATYFSIIPVLFCFVLFRFVDRWCGSLARRWCLSCVQGTYQDFILSFYLEFMDRTFFNAWNLQNLAGGGW